MPIKSMRVWDFHKSPISYQQNAVLSSLEKRFKRMEVTLEDDVLKVRTHAEEVHFDDMGNIVHTEKLEY